MQTEAGQLKIREIVQWSAEGRSSHARACGVYQALPALLEVGIIIPSSANKSYWGLALRYYVRTSSRRHYEDYPDSCLLLFSFPVSAANFEGLYSIVPAYHVLIYFFHCFSLKEVMKYLLG